MLSGGDYNSVQRYTDSLKEVLKKAMLEHDATFRSQVCELHRVYNLQKTLMEDLRWKDFNRHTSWESTNITPPAFQDPQKYTPWTEGKVVPTFSAVDSAQTEDRPLNLQPSANDYINLIGREQPETRDSCPSVIESLGLTTMKDSGLCTITKFFVEDLNGSFQEHKSFTLDAGEPFASSVSGPSECRASSLSVGLLTEKQPSSSLNTTDIDLNRPQLEESSHFSNSPVTMFPSPAASSSGVLQACSDESHKETRTIAPWWRQPNSSCPNETSELLQQDYASQLNSNESGEKSTGIQASFGSQKFKTNNGVIDLESLPEDDGLGSLENFRNSSFEHGEENINVPFKHASSGNMKFGTNSRANIGLIDLESMPDDGLGSWENFGNSSIGHGEENINVPFRHTSSGRANVGLIDLEALPEDGLGSCENFGNSVTEPGEEQISVPFGQQCTVIRDSSQVGNPIEGPCSEVVGNPVCSSIEGGGDLCQTAPVAENVPDSCEKNEEDVVSSCHDPRNKLQKGLKEMDDLACGAVEALVKISFEKAVCSLDQSSNAGKEESTKEQSDSESYDSYESIVMRLKEISVDDYSVTPMAVEVKDVESKGSRCALQRGRRLKDFQKEILPGIVSLSRHEICEDMHNFALINPKPSRRSRSKKASEENRCVPVRSRRSRPSKVARRDFS